jgi:hypothetical protein
MGLSALERDVNIVTDSSSVGLRCGIYADYVGSGVEVGEDQQSIDAKQKYSFSSILIWRRWGKWNRLDVHHWLSATAPAGANQACKYEQQ